MHTIYEALRKMHVQYNIIVTLKFREQLDSWHRELEAIRWEYTEGTVEQ